jgi:hypothetical protein
LTTAKPRQERDGERSGLQNLKSVSILKYDVDIDHGDVKTMYAGTWAETALATEKHNRNRAKFNEYAEYRKLTGA